jgi:hypothetical protein
MSKQKNPTYRLRFFFDYGSGGCLWCANEATYRKYDVGPLDAEIFDMDGKLSHEARIKLPETTRRKVLALDKLYGESIRWEDPAGNSPWDKAQWDSFYFQARQLHQEISTILGDDFDIEYNQE